MGGRNHGDAEPVALPASAGVQVEKEGFVKEIRSKNFVRIRS
jgi:hypothetical protein